MTSLELAKLQTSSYRELQDRYAELFGEGTQSRNRVWLIKRIAWRLQANAEGDLSERARRRIAELANDDDLRISAPRIKTTEQAVEVDDSTPPDRRLPQAGTILSRPYKGETIQVLVREDGFEYEGILYRTLTAVAKTVTGSHCNGFRFFRLGGAS